MEQAPLAPSLTLPYTCLFTNCPFTLPNTSFAWCPALGAKAINCQGPSLLKQLPRCAALVFFLREAPVHLPLTPHPWPFVAHSVTRLTPPGPYRLVVSMCVPSRPRDEVTALLSFRDSCW